MHTYLPLVLFFFYSTNIPTSNSAHDYRYTNCSQPFNCGTLTDIGYPFWGENRPDYCGQPGFELNFHNNTPLITFNSIAFRILEINPQFQLLGVSRDDFFHDICPDHFYNTSIDLASFNYAPGLRNLTLLYGCDSVPNATYLELLRLPDCVINDTDVNVYCVPADLSLNLCSSSVVIPVLETNARLVENNDMRVIDAFKEGFGLQWRMSNDQCNRCVDSGGVCGFDTTTNRFTCFCHDQPSAFACASTRSGGKSKSVGLGVGLGIAGAAIAGISLACWFLLIVQKRKRMTSQKQSKDVEPPTPLIKGQAVPISNFSRTTPSYPSSKPDLEKGSTYFGTQVFSYEELVEATDNFDPSKELGDGGFGIVYYGILKDGRVVAVKRLYENNIKRAEQFMNEVEILTRLRHKNLVTLYGCTSKRSRELLLVYEYIPNGTVADHLHGRNRLDSGLLPGRVRLSIAIETADALSYLHKSDVIHRDVKTNNILLDSNFHVKVVDFGLSRLFPNDVSHVSTAPQGTPGYVDPEYYQCYQLTDKSDVYSFGVVLIELISSLPAVDTNRHRLDINLANMAVTKIQNRQVNELVDPSLGFETDAQVRKMLTSVAELAFRCLQQEKDMRPTMAEVLECLKKIEYEHYGLEKAEPVDIKEDDVGLLSFSQDSGPTDKWVSSSTTTTTATTSSF